MSPPRHISYPLAYYYVLQVYMSTRRQNPQNHTSTTGHHVTTSLHLLSSTTTYYRSTGQHIDKTLRFILYHRSTCPHLAIYLILYYYYLPQVHRSTRRQNPQNHTNTTGHLVTTSPYISLSTTTYYRSTGQHVVKTLRTIPALQVTMSPSGIISYPQLTLQPTTCLHVNTSSKPSDFKDYYRSPCLHLVTSLLHYYYLLQVNTSTKPSESYSTTGQHVPISPYISYSTTTYYRSTGQQVVKTPRIIPIPQVTMSPPRHIYHSLLLPTTGLQVNMSSKPPESYHNYRSPCHHLAIYLILYYHLLQVYRSTGRQNPQNHTNTTGHHVTTSPYISFSTTTYYRSTG